MSNRNFSRDASGMDQSVIQKEVANLIKNGNESEYSRLADLRSRYKDSDLVDTIFETYQSKLRAIQKKVLKFKNSIYQKYTSLNLSPQDLIQKGRKYARKYKLTDDEFQMFVNMLKADKTSSTAIQGLPTSPLAKTLGYSHVTATSDRLRVSDNELDVVNEIIRLHAETKDLHSQVILQTLTYRDCAPEALSGSFDKAFVASRQNVYSFIHPVLAALFIPKVRLLDEHMLLSNIGYIVKCKQEGREIMTKPDFELYWEMITDPTAHVCDTSSPIKDLYNRYVLQTRVWDCVLNLRQGKYYDRNYSNFMLAVENCDSSFFDAPDLTYVKDEGTVLRRLLGAFAIRPTIVSTSRLYNIVSGHNLSYQQNPLSAAGITHMTTVPMITVRLPYNVAGVQTTVDLESSLSQPQWYVEDKMIVPKTQNILHSRNVLFFYVGRRFQSINLTRTRAPYNFTALPMTVTGWERLNTTPVQFKEHMNILNDNYHLRSVVTLDTADNNNNLIIGCSACIIGCGHAPGITNMQRPYLLYDPLEATRVFSHNGQHDRNNPITEIPADATAGAPNVGVSFYERATHRGTVFMYVKESDMDCYGQEEIMRF